MDWEQKAVDLERGLSEGTISGSFLIDNASSRNWYGAMVELSEQARDPESLRAMIRGILKHKNLGNMGNNRRKKIVGIGSAALKILNVLKGQDISLRDILFLDRDPWIIRESSFSNLELPWANMLFMTRRKDGEYVPLSWGGIHHGGPCLGRLMALGSIKQIAGMFKDVNSVIMVATLGGATGSGVSPIVAGVLREIGIKLNSITQIPFPFEGKKRTENALESLKIIKQYADNVIIVEGIEVLKKLSKEMTLLDAYKVLDMEMTSCLKNINTNESKVKEEPLSPR